ncbi:hypothetical protein [Streptomyces sp. NBC_01565]|uniref:hypothetical protein n=1 Tax=Streptomyces sp. NBC_01565 TaxID=2975881 RepID=UPI00224E81F6|nr:hypothetical protein [Streptomyces sp. NBC_01565]MCX4546439.1 hypothetical protein [Streptomyces sp. NBC_01565]
MNGQRAVGPAAAAYAAALRAAVHGFTARSGTQKEIAVAAHVAPATLSRYLSGERIAPHGFIASLDTFLMERGQPLGNGVRERLEELCGRAHEASRSPAVQLEHLKQELARVRGEKRAGDVELAALKADADQLAGDLEQALEQARRAVAERGVLVRRVDEQDQQLQSAQSYTRRLEAELTAQHDQVVLVQREVEVLRRQNKSLLDESTATATASGETLERAVPVVSTQAGKGEADRGTPQPLPPQDVPSPTRRLDTREAPVQTSRTGPKPITEYPIIPITERIPLVALSFVLASAIPATSIYLLVTRAFEQQIKAADDNDPIWGLMAILILGAVFGVPLALMSLAKLVETVRGRHRHGRRGRRGARGR